MIGEETWKYMTITSPIAPELYQSFQDFNIYEVYT